MTREEISKRLKNIADHAVHTQGEPPLILSLDDGIALYEAIEALSQEPTEDCISRQTLLNHLYNFKTQSEGIVQSAILAIENCVEDMSSVQPASSKGMWIDKDTNGANTCSVCGKRTCSYEVNYCPNCGADMRGKA